MRTIINKQDAKHPLITARGSYMQPSLAPRVNWADGIGDFRASSPTPEAQTEGESQK